MHITDTTAAASFMFAGKATFSLKSRVTGAHHTYRITTSKDGALFFVAVVVGGSKLYAGVIPADNRTTFRSTRAAKVERNHPAVVTIEWYLRNVGHEQVEVHHEGQCGRCARKLTHPESISNGIGPECIKKLAA